MSFPFKVKENFQRYGDIFFDILITTDEQGGFGSRYVLIYFETEIGCRYNVFKNRQISG